MHFISNNDDEIKHCASIILFKQLLIYDVNILLLKFGGSFLQIAYKETVLQNAKSHDETAISHQFNSHGTLSSITIPGIFGKYLKGSGRRNTFQI